MSIFDVLGIGKLKGASKILDAGLSGLDKIIFTSEEKADLALKMGEQHIALMNAIAQESTPQSLSRRYLTLLVVGAFTFLIIGSALIDFVAVAMESENFQALAKRWYEKGKDSYGWATTAAIVFYFGSQSKLLTGLIKKKD